MACAHLSTVAVQEDNSTNNWESHGDLHIALRLLKTLMCRPSSLISASIRALPTSVSLVSRPDSFYSLKSFSTFRDQAEIKAPFTPFSRGAVSSYNHIRMAEEATLQRPRSSQGHASNRARNVSPSRRPSDSSVDKAFDNITSRTYLGRTDTKASDWRQGMIIRVPHLVPTMGEEDNPNHCVWSENVGNICPKMRHAIIVAVYHARMIVLPIFSANGTGITNKPNVYKSMAMMVLGAERESVPTSVLRQTAGFLLVNGRWKPKRGSHINLNEPVAVQYAWPLVKIDELESFSTAYLQQRYQNCQEVGQAALEEQDTLFSTLKSQALPATKTIEVGHASPVSEEFPATGTIDLTSDLSDSVSEDSELGPGIAQGQQHSSQKPRKFLSLGDKPLWLPSKVFVAGGSDDFDPRVKSLAYFSRLAPKGEHPFSKTYFEKFGPPQGWPSVWYVPAIRLEGPLAGLPDPFAGKGDNGVLNTDETVSDDESSGDDDNAAAPPQRRSCKHRCKDKAKCLHKCCKQGIISVLTGSSRQRTTKSRSRNNNDDRRTHKALSNGWKTGRQQWNGKQSRYAIAHAKHPSDVSPRTITMADRNRHDLGNAVGQLSNVHAGKVKWHSA